MVLSESPAEGRQTNARTMVVLAATLLLAAILRVLFLGTQSLWYDEAVSAFLAGVDWRNFYTLVTTWESNMTLHHVLLRLWVMVAGDSETAVRALSVVWSLATLPVAYALGARLFGRRAGLIGMLFLSVNAFHIQYAQEARAYSLVTLFVTLACYFFVRGMETRSPASWAGFSIAAALATYSHFFGVLVVPVVWMSLVFLRRRDVPWRQLILSTVAVFLLVSPLVVVLATMNENLGQNAWVPPTQFRTIIRLANAFAGAGGSYALPGYSAGVVAKRLLLVAYSLLGLVAVWKAGDSLRFSGRSERTWRLGFVLTWLVVPTALTLAISILKPLLIIRYLIISLPALMLLAAFATTHMRSRWATAAAGVVLLLGVYNTTLYYSYEKKEDWRGFTRYVLAHADVGDSILFYPNFANKPFRYYQRTLGSATQYPDVTVLLDVPRSSAHGRIWFAVVYEDLLGPYPRVREIEMALSPYIVDRARDFSPLVPAKISLYRRVGPK